MQALGMESGAIADSQITASSEYDSRYGDCIRRTGQLLELGQGLAPGQVLRRI